MPKNQDKGLSRDFPVMLAEFSLDLVVRKQVKLNPVKLPWRFIYFCYHEINSTGVLFFLKNAFCCCCYIVIKGLTNVYITAVVEIIRNP